MKYKNITEKTALGIAIIAVAMVATFAILLTLKYYNLK